MTVENVFLKIIPFEIDYIMVFLVFLLSPCFIWCCISLAFCSKLHIYILIYTSVNKSLLPLSCLSVFLSPYLYAYSARLNRLEDFMKYFLNTSFIYEYNPISLCSVFSTQTPIYNLPLQYLHHTLSGRRIGIMSH